MIRRIAGFFVIVSFLLQSLLPIAAEALSFNPNNIISDSDFFNASDMSLDDIQTFLERRGSGLSRYMTADVDGTIQSAAHIIDRAAKDHGINPKVLLVLLQKEQSLIGDPNPSDRSYDWATGYAVCDSCSTSDPRVIAFRGFATQVDRAAAQKKQYVLNPLNFFFRAGLARLVDGIPVTPENGATAALYNYTPHIHGNLSFWKLWNRFFGKQFPDGTVVKQADTESIWLIANGRRKQFASMGAFLSRYSMGQLVTASKNDLDAYPIDGKIKFPLYSLLQTPKGAIFLAVNEGKYGIASKKIFQTLGYNPEEIIRVAESDIADIPTVGSITTVDTNPVGELAQNKKTGAIYYTLNNARHPLLEPAILKAKYSYQKIKKVSPKDLDRLTLAEPILFPDGTLISEAGSPTVYIISNGYRRPFINGDAFSALGYQWSQVIQTNGKTLNLHPLGDSIDIGRDFVEDSVYDMVSAQAVSTDSQP